MADQSFFYSMPTKYTPTWAIYEKDLQHPDPKIAEEAYDNFHREREAEMARNPQARKWEEDRKKRVAKEKHDFVKSRNKDDQLKEIRDIVSQSKKGGKHESGFRPAAGYLLVKFDEPATEKAGIVLPEDVAPVQPNTATVLACGERASVNSLPIPAEAGERVLLKYGAGMDIEVKGVKAKIIVFDDVLGVFDA